MVKRKEVLETMVKWVKEGRALLIIGLKDREASRVISLNGFAGKYHSSVEHLGLGCFRGETESGEFEFDGGGAMLKPLLDKGEDYISYTTLDASPEVLKELNYPFEKVIEILEKEIAES